MDKIRTIRWASPAGELVLGSIGDCACLCDWANGRGDACQRVCRLLGAECEEGPSAVIDRMLGELQEYFAGQRRAFDVPLRQAGTAFQRRVWGELMRIPYGAVISYAELARLIGDPKAVRAVAAANAANPLSIFAPCHRVIGSGGALVGYSGGIRAKRILLDIEARAVGGVLPLLDWEQGQ